MIMELENIVANTVLVNAREGGDGKHKGRSKHWRKLISLPNLWHCEGLRAKLDLSYEYIVQQQPIGKQLFQRFCTRQPELTQTLDFLDRSATFDMAIEEEKPQMARSIFAELLASTEKSVLGVTDDHIQVVREALAQPNMPANILQDCTQAAREFLSNGPFQDFLQSLYFDRYLQFKWIEEQPISKQYFRHYRVLGKGGFGEVCACQTRTTGKLYAMKKLEKKRVKKRKGEAMALNEKQILEKVNSRFVVNLIYAFETKEELCMVLTLMDGGDLKYHIHHMGDSSLSMERAIFYTAEMTCGLQHLHEASIVYRDMKPENILLDDRGHVRISDLGLAIELPPGKAAHGRVGTVGYMAPEVIRNDRYRYSVDWWGLGCIVFEMIQGKAPFRARKEKVTREEVERRVLNDAETYSSKFTDEAKEICQRLLDKAPSSRLTKASHVKRMNFFSTLNWAHLEAGKKDPPFVPDPRAVYAKDVLDIDHFSSVRGVALDAKDDQFFQKFATGCVSAPWQQELVDTKVFNDLNVYGPEETRSIDLIAVEPPPPQRRRGLLGFFKRQRSSASTSS